MVEIELTADALVVHVKGADRIFALKSELTILKGTFIQIRPPASLDGASPNHALESVDRAETADMMPTRRLATAHHG